MLFRSALAIYTPPGYDPKRAEPYPLIVQLHGGGGSSQNMTLMAAMPVRTTLSPRSWATTSDGVTEV